VLPVIRNLPLLANAVGVRCGSISTCNQRKFRRMSTMPQWIRPNRREWDGPLAEIEPQGTKPSWCLEDGRPTRHCAL